jgi:gentisate 1,2-dioxygenase
VEPGHAAIRFTDPTSGRDALSTIRLEMHRVAAGVHTARSRHVGSSVWQVFDGSGTVHVGEETYDVGKGDLFAVPSWAPVAIDAATELDIFRFSDEPVYEALGLARTEQEPRA